MVIIPTNEYGNHIIYPRIDELQEDLLDVLAHDLHVDWYEDTYLTVIKRNIIKDSVKIHKHLGTKYAVVTAIKAVSSTARVREWFEYGGEPFHFRVEIKVSDGIISDEIEKIIKAAKFYKRLSSHLDGVFTAYNTHFDLSSFPHALLSHYTHHQIRNDDLGEIITTVWDDSNIWYDNYIWSDLNTWG